MIIKILQYPDSRLRRKAEKVDDFGPKTQRMVDDMFETHYAQENCAALASTQLDFNHPKHMTVIDYSKEKDQPLCLINAEILEKKGLQFEEEGCMSVGIESCRVFDKVQRAHSITVRAQDRHGKPLTLTAEGFLAKCIQHELDHLHGILFIDHLSLLKRSRVIKKLKNAREIPKAKTS